MLLRVKWGHPGVMRLSATGGGVLEREPGGLGGFGKGCSGRCDLKFVIGVAFLENHTHRGSLHLLTAPF